MGGSIRVKSQLGKGTTIYIELVFERASSPPSEAPRNALRKPRSKSLIGKRILLCEDHPLNQEIAKALLTKRGLLVDTADNGAAGVKIFKESSIGFFDCVLMDIRMPIMNGYEAAGIIRALSRPDAKTIPIIAMTADAFSEDIQKCLDAGMNGHIAKPIDPETLYGALAEAILKKRESEVENNE